MKSILDPTFKYTPAVQTDIRKTFRRIRQEQKEETARKQEQERVVTPLRRGRV